MIEKLQILYPLTTAIIALFIAQAIKPLGPLIKTGKFKPELMFASGGAPSSHTAMISALLFSILFKEGFYSSIFAVTAILTIVIAYDAMNVRYYSGINNQLTKQLIEDLKDELHITLDLDNPIYSARLKEVIGHEKIEVFLGFICGFLLAILFYFIYY